MIIAVLLICAIYILALSARVFILNRPLYGGYFMENGYLSGGDFTDAYTADRFKDIETSSTAIFPLKELVGSETTYTHSLRQLTNLYFKTTIEYLKSKPRTPTYSYLIYILNEVMIKRDILEIHERFIESLKYMKFEKEVDIYNICKWFNKNMARLAMGYVGFSQAHEALVATYAYILHEEPALSELIKAKEAEKNIVGEMIDSFLIKPIQRFPRYQMLLNEIKKSGSAEIKDALQNTVDLVIGEIKKYNQALHTHPNHIILYEVLATLKFPKAIMAYNTQPQLALLYVINVKIAVISKAKQAISAFKFDQGAAQSNIVPTEPTSFYLCNNIMFYVKSTWKLKDKIEYTNKKDWIYDDKFVLAPNKVNITNIKELQLTITNEGSLMSLDKLNISFNSLEDLQRFENYIKNKRFY